MEYGLYSLANQTLDKDKYEVIVVDQRSTDNIQYVISRARSEFDLDVKYVKIDPAKFKGAMYKGPSINPALQQNVGIRLATGDIVVLTSPEIVHANTNLETIQRMSMVQTPISLYGTVFESPLEWVRMLEGDNSFEVLNNLPRGVTLLPNLEGEKRISAYFIGAFWKKHLEEIGGMDEQYMGGIAFEDDDFGLRMATVASPVHSNKILGIHLPHDRSYQRDEGWVRNSDLFKAKGFDRVPKLIDNYAVPQDYIANVNHNWGNLDTIIEVA